MLAEEEDELPIANTDVQLAVQASIGAAGQDRGKEEACPDVCPDVHNRSADYAGYSQSFP